MLNVIKLLIEARRLTNQTVRDYKEVERWHRQVDEVLAELPNDDVSQRWDAPARGEHRQFVNSLFRRS